MPGFRKQETPRARRGQQIRVIHVRFTEAREVLRWSSGRMTLFGLPIIESDDLPAIEGEVVWMNPFVKL